MLHLQHQTQMAPKTLMMATATVRTLPVRPLGPETAVESTWGLRQALSLLTSRSSPMRAVQIHKHPSMEFNG